MKELPKAVITPPLSKLPRVSVVMPAHNAEPYIGEAIASLRRQTFADWELIVVDDGSTDHTARIVLEAANADPRISLYHRPSASGCAFTPRTQAVELARADFICPIDADDYVSPDYLQLLIERRDATNARIVYPRMVSIDNNGNEIRSLPSRPELLDAVGTGRSMLKYTIDGWVIGCNGGLTDKQLYLSTIAKAGLDFNYVFGDELLERFLLLNAGIVAIASGRYYYRANPTSVTHTPSLSLFDPMKNNAFLTKFVSEHFESGSYEVCAINAQNLRGIYDGLKILRTNPFSSDQRAQALELLENCRRAIDWKLLRGRISAPYYWPLRLSLRCADLTSRIICFIKRR